MSAYNELTCEVDCPRCGKCAIQRIEFKAGKAAQVDYSLGDHLEWDLGRTVKNGGRPVGGNLTCEGYAECVLCRKDFWVTISIIGDKVSSVTANPSRSAYIP